jgi:hypothetical protein
MRCRASDLRPFSVVVFGDGELPELLLTCMQFRLVADLASEGRARPSHVMQLRRHLRQGRCSACRGYLMGRLSEKRSALRLRRR